MDKINIANCLTVSRIALVFPIVVLLYFPSLWTCWIAAALFCVASFTDYLDGAIARRTNMVSTFGKFLDPLADKLLISSVLIMLSTLEWVPAWIVIVIVGRELAVTGLRSIAAGEGVIIAADKYGKLKTVTQIFAIIPLIIHYPLWGIPLHSIGTFLLYIALCLTVFSGINYFYGYYAEWKKRNAGAP